MDSPKPTSGATWRKDYDEGVLIQLPSGNVARLRPVSTRTFIDAGLIPDTLTPLVEQLIQTGAMQTKTRDDFRQMDDILTAFCKSCFVSPKVVDEPAADDEIGPEHISDDDKRFVFNFLGQGAFALRSFRAVQENPLVNLVGLSGDSSNAE